MIIKGKPLADKILTEIQTKIERRNLQPRLAIILAGEDPASRVYIKYKAEAAQKIGIITDIYECSPNEQKKCLKQIKKLNNDKQTHGIIVQLPLYKNWNPEEYVYAVDTQKDVDGFIDNSPFYPATAAGTWEMINQFAHIEGFQTAEEFLLHKNITVIGKGRTAGKPIITLLENKGQVVTIIDSKTENVDNIIFQSDLIIAAAGKKNIVNIQNIKLNSYVIGIGTTKQIIDGVTKTYGDVDEKNIVDKVKLLCPTIGGIGPLTIACLLRNVCESAERT